MSAEHGRLDSRALDPALFKRWLDQNGWTQRSEGRLGSMYQFGDTTVAIPDQLPRDREIAKDVAARVANAMERDFADIWKRLNTPLSDRIQYRLIGDAAASGRVPLGAAMDTLRNARKMLSTTGTSVMTPGVRSIGRRYRHEAQVLARDAELAHTEDGSFVFPLYVVLDSAQEPLGYEGATVLAEPYERRVTRTLATALSTAVELSTTSVEGLSEDDLDLASGVGVSREFCLAVRSLMHHAVDRVEVSFEWSQGFASTDALPTSVNLSPSIRPQLARLADRLATKTVIDPKVYSGDILQIGHDPDSNLFFFVLDTYHRARRTTLRVGLSADQHAQAIHWYEDRATVVVRGFAVEQAAGLAMPSPDRVEAWGSDRLGVPTVE